MSVNPVQQKSRLKAGGLVKGNDRSGLAAAAEQQGRTTDQTERNGRRLGDDGDSEALKPPK
jgi:hypothetical protein